MRGLVILLLGLSACTPPPPTCGPSGSAVGNFVGTPDAGPTTVGVTGKPLVVKLAHFRRDSCISSAEVTTEVLDPLNRPMPHTHSDVVLEDLIAFNTTLTFTPTMAGSYHLTARFEPSIGTTQADVLVAPERTAPPQTTLNLGVQCRALELTSSGLALCLVSNSRLLRVYRGDVFLQELEVDDVATSGDVVWTARLGTVRRQVDDGGAAPLGAGSVFVTSPQDAGATLIAHEDEALFINSEETVKLRVVDGGLVEAAWALVGNTAHATHPSATLDALMFANSAEGLFELAKACISPIPNPQPVPTCRDMGRFEVFGSDSTGLWSGGEGNLRHDRFGPDGGLAIMLLPANVSLVGARSTHHEQTPILHGNGFRFVPRWSAEGISLEAYALEPGFVLMPSSAQILRAQHPDGRQQLFKR